MRNKSKAAEESSDSTTTDNTNLLSSQETSRSEEDSAQNNGNNESDRIIMNLSNYIKNVSEREIEMRSSIQRLEKENEELKSLLKARHECNTDSSEDSDKEVGKLPAADGQETKHDIEMNDSSKNTNPSENKMRVDYKPASTQCSSKIRPAPVYKVPFVARRARRVLKSTRSSCDYDKSSRKQPLPMISAVAESSRPKKAGKKALEIDDIAAESVSHMTQEGFR
jgi:hypothetical protein